MSKDTLIPINSVKTRDLTDSQLSSAGKEQDSAFRVFRSSPDGATIQLRSFGPITYTGQGKSRRIMTSASYVGADKLREIITALQTVLDDLEGN